MTTLHHAPPVGGSFSPPQAVLIPESVDEALRLLAEPGAAVLGGGVGHVLRRHDRRPADATSLVAVAYLPGLDTVTWSADQVVIGAGVRLSAIEQDARLAAVWPVVTEAAGSVATARIRRLVTLGGNLAAADDSHDPPVALAAVGAELTVRSADSVRTLRIADLVGPAGLRPGELIQDIRLPLPAVWPTGLGGSASAPGPAYAHARPASAAPADPDGPGAASGLAGGVGRTDPGGPGGSGAVVGRVDLGQSGPAGPVRASGPVGPGEPGAESGSADTVGLTGPAGPMPVPGTVGPVGEAGPAAASGSAVRRGGVGSAYEKFLVRGVWEYACVNVAAVVRLDAEGVLRGLSLAVGSVTGGPVLVDVADLVGGAVNAAVTAEAARRAAAATRPYSDVRGSAAYKSRMITEFARRALVRAARRAAEGVDR